MSPMFINTTFWMTVKLKNPRNYLNTMNSIEKEVFATSTRCSTWALIHLMNIAKKQYKSGFTVLLFARDVCVKRQHGQVISASDSQSSGPGFEFRFRHLLDLFLGSPECKSSATLVNSQLVCLWPVGILNNDYIQFKLVVLVVCSAPLALVV